MVVYDGEGDFTIYGYPREVFPPTDFHTATLVGEWIYIIGSLGYPEDRHYGHTQVFRLSTIDFHMERVDTSGEDPGWIDRHRARLVTPDTIEVSGGKICKDEDSYDDHVLTHEFDLSSHAWRRVDS